MKNILLILLITISFIGCGQNGIQKEYYDNGNLRSERNYKNGNLNGISKLYHLDGYLLSKKNYKNGELHDEGWNYYQNGKVYIKSNYKNGKDDGVWKFYYPNGEIKRKWIFKDGKLLGKQCWDKDGVGYHLTPEDIEQGITCNSFL